MPGQPDLTKLIRDLEKVADPLPEDLGKVVKKGAHEIMTEWRSKLRERSDYGHIPHLPAKVNYDVQRLGGLTTAEIGVDKGGQGNLGHFLEWGTSRTPPGLEGLRSLEQESPEVEKYVGKIADRVVRKLAD